MRDKRVDHLIDAEANYKRQPECRPNQDDVGPNLYQSLLVAWQPQQKSSYPLHKRFKHLVPLLNWNDLIIVPIRTPATPVKSMHEASTGGWRDRAFKCSRMEFDSENDQRDVRHHKAGGAIHAPVSDPESDR